MASGMDSDLYLLIRQYAVKSASWEIPYDAFMDHLRRMAKGYAGKSEEMASFSSEAKTTAQLHLLSADRRIALLQSDSQIHSILLPDRFTEPVRQEYRKMLESPEIPFPDEDLLKMAVPSEWVQNVSLESDLSSLLLREELPDVPLCRISFPGDVRAILVLTDHLRDKLLEFAVLKVRSYLRKGSNLEFSKRKLLAAFQNKEMILKDSFNLVLTRPYDAVEQMRGSRADMVFSFWAYLVSAIRQDLMKRGDMMPEDLSCLRALYVAEFFNNHYKGQAQKAMEIETAFKAFDAQVRKPPYLYQYEDLVAFTDQAGRPLIGRYSKEEFDAYLGAKLSAPDFSRLPEIVQYQTDQGRRFFTAKDRVLNLAMKLITDAREEVRARLIEEWYKALGNYEAVPAMADDDAYRKSLSERLEKASPVLSVLIREKFILLAYVEMRGTKEYMPELDRLFAKGELVPVEELLSLPRKGLLTDVRILLPFWYSIGFLVRIVRFFRSLNPRRPQKAAAMRVESQGAPPAATPDRQRELRDAAARVERGIVPAGLALDDWLIELESKWNTLLDPQSKRNLTEDVNALVRDYIRNVIRTLRGTNFTEDRIRQLADTLAGSPGLMKIRNAPALKSYIMGYIVRLVKKAV
jgi:hypothetical protein